MSTLVLKFGGTSMQTVKIIQHVAKLIKQKKEAKDFDHILVVVSAMAKQTNQLCQWVTETEVDIDSVESHSTYIDSFKQDSFKQDSFKQDSLNHGSTTDNLETDNSFWNKDFVISTGEQITAGLLALCLQKLGLKALALSGWQIPIITNQDWSNASIESVNTDLLEELFQKGIIPVVTGFQGITNYEHITNKPFPLITTLGRGGSDTTAVALACALKASQCDIYTDVPGIFITDPNIVPTAKLISEIDYTFLEQLTCAGAKVVHPEAARLASKHKINMNIVSTFAPEKKGTKVVEQAHQPTCFVHKEIIGLKCHLTLKHNTISIPAILENAITYQYDPNTKLFTGFFYSKPQKLFADQIINNVLYFKVYKITVLNPTKELLSLDLSTLLLQSGIQCLFLNIPNNDFYKDSIKDNTITLIVNEKDLQTTLVLLNNLY
jgi:aspartate kinase